MWYFVLASVSGLIGPGVNYKRSLQVLATAIDGETVILAMTTGVYHSLGGVGARIWELLESPAAVDQIAEKIAAEYSVPVEMCREDTLAFLDQLQNAGLIEEA